MGVFKWFRKRLYAWQNPEILQKTLERAQEIRENEQEIRRLTHERKLMEQKLKIERLKAQMSEYEGYDDDDQENTQNSPESMLMSVIGAALMSKLGGQGQNNTISAVNPPFLQEAAQPTLTTSPTPINQAAAALPDDIIRKEIKAIPKKWLKIAKNLDDNTIKAVISSQTSYNQATIDRALHIFRNEKF